MDRWETAGSSGRDSNITVILNLQNNKAYMYIYNDKQREYFTSSE